MRGILIASTIMAGSATIALDLYRASERHRALAGQFPDVDPSAMAAPDPGEWRGTPLVPGKEAPGFTLVDVRSGKRVSLADQRGRPVVLVLSSFGCNAFCSQLPGLVELSQRYSDRVAFLFVVIRDAGHPDAGTPAHDKPLAADAPVAAKLERIHDGLAFYRVPFATLFDEDGKVEQEYRAFPKRLLVIDAAGQIVHDGGKGAGGGPSDWDLAAVSAELEALLGFTR